MGFFREFMKSMQSNGHKVGILTAHRKLRESSDLVLLRMNGFPDPDFWIGRDNWGIRVDHPAVFKSKAILEFMIDMHFDDCDNDDTENVSLFREFLGNEFYRLVRVHCRAEKGKFFE
jgi:hypothetical protein